MAHQQFAGLAVLVAFTFALLALAACANLERRAGWADAASRQTAAAEFHGAPIGADRLRSRLDSE
jgi:hypothetical protein